MRSRTVTHFVFNALPAITVSLRESQCFPHSRLSGLARRRYSEAHRASSLRSVLQLWSRCASLSVFLARACRRSLGVATRKPTGLPPYAPPLNPSWRQAS